MTAEEIEMVAIEKEIAIDAATVMILVVIIIIIVVIVEKVVPIINQRILQNQVLIDLITIM